MSGIHSIEFEKLLVTERLVSVKEDAIIAAESKISDNLGLPNNGTERWAEVQKEDGFNLWHIPKPPIGGRLDHGEFFTQEKMLEGVVMDEILTEALEHIGGI